MRNRQQFGLLCVSCIVLALALLQPSLCAHGQDERYVGRTITGTAYGFSGRFAGRSSPFTLIVNRYTSAADVQRLNAALQSGGQDELLRALSGLNAGRIQLGGGVGVPANVIIATPQPNGETKLTVVYQRNIRFSELRYGSRSEDYKFGYAELFLGRNGQGQGTFIPAAKIRLREGNTWEVEDFGTFPARLLGLRARGGRNAR
ncbi:MAG TPA: hypothetical protein VF525_02005 [Pyrinomonadaceae bacterium]|jgi:hypothetical protein